MYPKHVRKTFIKTHLIGSINPVYEYKLSEVEEIYRYMKEINILEIQIEKLYEEGLVRGFCHLDIGQECIYAALKAIFEEEDRAIGSYRCHALAYATGSKMEKIFGEVLGRIDGCSQGKGGSMHVYNDHMFGGNGIVGAQAPLGCGVAFALKYDTVMNKIPVIQGVTFCFIGDGATNQGQVFEAYNLSYINSLPIVYVIMNNKYGMWTKTSKVSPDTDYYSRTNYMPGMKLESHNVFDVIACLHFARNYALINGPIILQIECYRTCGHSTTDSVKYREDDEIEEEKKLDCIKMVKEIIDGRFESNSTSTIDKQAKNAVIKAKERAKFMYFPETMEMLKNIYKY